MSAAQSPSATDWLPPGQRCASGNVDTCDATQPFVPSPTPPSSSGGGDGGGNPNLKWYIIGAVGGVVVLVLVSVIWGRIARTGKKKNNLDSLALADVSTSTGAPPQRPKSPDLKLHLRPTGPDPSSSLDADDSELKDDGVGGAGGRSVTDSGIASPFQGQSRAVPPPSGYVAQPANKPPMQPYPPAPPHPSAFPAPAGYPPTSVPVPGFPPTTPGFPPYPGAAAPYAGYPGGYIAPPMVPGGPAGAYHSAAHSGAGWQQQPYGSSGPYANAYGVPVAAAAAPHQFYGGSQYSQYQGSHYQGSNYGDQPEHSRDAANNNYSNDNNNNSNNNNASRGSNKDDGVDLASSNGSGVAGGATETAAPSRLQDRPKDRGHIVKPKQDAWSRIDDFGDEELREREREMERISSAAAAARDRDRDRDRGRDGGDRDRERERDRSRYPRDRDRRTDHASEDDNGGGDRRVGDDGARDEYDDMRRQNDRAPRDR